MPLLEVHHLSLQHHNRWLLRDIHCQFAAAQLYAMLGPNGAGKTTLLRLLAALIKPTAGHILLQQRDLQHYARLELARHISYMPQHFQLDFGFRVREWVAQGRYPHLKRWHALGAEDQAHIEAALHLTDTTHLEQRLITRLSGGERQRVLLARCLCSQSQILLLDEPVANLDVRHRLEFLQLCQTLVQRGKTLIISLHDINQALVYAQQVLLLQGGRLFAQGAPAEVLTAETIQTVFQVQAVLSTTALASPRFEFYV